MRAAALALAFAVPAGGWAGDAVYLLRGAQPVTVARNGFVQVAAEAGGGWWRVEVATDLSPLGAVPGKAPAPGHARRVPPGFGLPRELAVRLSRLGDPWERATGVLLWAMTRIRYDARDTGPQDAASVLVRRRGRCSGLANAAVGLLRTAGIPARTVSGVLVREGRAIPHRWLEAALPGAGWVPTDPTLGLWVVTPAHVACAEPAAAPVTVSVVERSGVGLDGLPLRAGWPCRPGRGAALTCRVGEGAGRRLARLVGPGGEERVVRLDRTVTLHGLLPGRWRVLVERDGAVVRRFGIRLEEGAAAVLWLGAGEGAG